MSKTGIEGSVQKAVGSAKEGVGKAVGNKKLQAEGLADRAAGTAKQGVGKAQDAVRKATR
jgi:uncharacterized protein YjbJ (UPF0337 family)